MRFLLALALAFLPLCAPAAQKQECVILLHALCRTSRSMIPLERALTNAGYQVLNVDYPSRTTTIEPMSENAIGPAIEDCRRRGATQIHFVTHSMGGILVRSYLARHTPPVSGRVVMLGPPNQGSELVDKLGWLWLFKEINGPAGGELGTKEDSTPNRLGPAHFCLGIIAGNRSINWINSLLIPGRDDGKVSVERTKLAGMTDHIVIPVTHPFMMRNETVIQQTIDFLRTASFDHPTSMRADSGIRDKAGLMRSSGKPLPGATFCVAISAGRSSGWMRCRDTAVNVVW